MAWGLQQQALPNIAGFYSTSAPMGLESQQALQQQQQNAQMQQLAFSNQAQQEQMAQQNDLAVQLANLQGQQQLKQEAFKNTLANQAQQQQIQQLVNNGVPLQQAILAVTVGPEAFNKSREQSFALQQRQQTLDTVNQQIQAAKTTFEQDPRNKGSQFEVPILLQLQAQAALTGTPLEVLANFYIKNQGLTIDQQNALSQQLSAEASASNAQTNQTRALYQNQLNSMTAQNLAQTIQNQESINGAVNTINNPAATPSEVAAAYNTLNVLGGRKPLTGQQIKDTQAQGTVTELGQALANQSQQASALAQLGSWAGNLGKDTANVIFGEENVNNLYKTLTPAVTGAGKVAEQGLKNITEKGIIPAVGSELFRLPFTQQPTSNQTTPKKPTTTPNKPKFVGR